MCRIGVLKIQTKIGYLMSTKVKDCFDFTSKRVCIVRKSIIGVFKDNQGVVYSGYSKIERIMASNCTVYVRDLRNKGKISNG
jgi:hypothetical protein